MDMEAGLSISSIAEGHRFCPEGPPMRAVHRKPSLAISRAIILTAVFSVVVLGFAMPPTAAAGPASKGQNCRLEKQCRWVNFKQICYYVRVCR
jgi:hypothetical protein